MGGDGDGRWGWCKALNVHGMTGVREVGGYQNRTSVKNGGGGCENVIIECPYKVTFEHVQIKLFCN